MAYIYIRYIRNARALLSAGERERGGKEGGGGREGEGERERERERERMIQVLTK